MKKTLLNWQAFFVLLLSLGLMNQAMADHHGHKHHNQKRLEIHLGGMHLKGENRIALKREIKANYPRINLKRYNLKRAILFAKTKHGKGKAKLRVGDYYTDYKKVGGTHPRLFRQDTGYKRVGFRSPKFGAQGPWQIWTKGNFKVLKVVVVLEKKFKRNRTIELDYNHSHYKGQNTLFLKNQLKKQYPNIDLSKYRLKSATLFAKTKFGRGTAQLKSGDKFTRKVKVGGRPENFRKYHHYYRNRFLSPNRHAKGPWQFKLRGNFKVKKVIVELERKRHKY